VRVVGVVVVGVVVVVVVCAVFVCLSATTVSSRSRTVEGDAFAPGLHLIVLAWATYVLFKTFQ
jgi:hypothetical protein